MGGMGGGKSSLSLQKKSRWGRFYMAVSEIKGAPCIRCAHFHDRVHDFRRCAPGVYTFFEPHIQRVHGEIPGRTVLREVHPLGAPNKTLILDTAWAMLKGGATSFHPLK